MWTGICQSKHPRLVSCHLCPLRLQPSSRYSSFPGHRSLLRFLGGSVSLLYNALIHVWHVHSACSYLFLFFCHRGYCRRWREALCEHQVLVEYLLQWQIFIYIREKYFCDSVHLRKSGDNPCGLSKSDTHLHLNLRVSLCAVNYFPCISFILPRKDITCCFLPLLLTYLAYDPWRSILVGKIGIIL